MKIRFPALAAISGALFGFGYSAAAQTQGSEIKNPFRGVMQDRSAHAPDEALFVEKCSMCHRRMGMGTVLLGRRLPASKAELENRTDLTDQYITLAARQGIGNMPRISRAEVSDEQLARIARHLKAGGKR
jgi:cytochrome c553